MAAKTFATSASTTGYVVPGKGVYGGEITITQDHVSDGNHYANRLGANLSIFYLDDVDAAGDTVASGLRNILAVAWQGRDPTDDQGSAYINDKDTGTIGVITENNNAQGWVWVLHGT